jgi:lipid A 4'-phosphatase
MGLTQDKSMKGLPAGIGSGPGVFLARNALGLSVALLAAVSILFMLLPSLDIRVSSLFYVEGVGFPAEQRSMGLLADQLAIWVVIGLTVLKLLARKRLRAVPSRVVAFLAATLVLGPGLIVNLLLKDHWGRARPIQTTLFGGAHDFSLPWIISDGCLRNCSFVSGEASGSFWFIALAFVVPPAARGVTLTVALLWALAISLNRIAFGGHFLSDVLIGWVLVLLVILVMRDLLLVRFGPAIDAKLD